MKKTYIGITPENLLMFDIASMIPHFHFHCHTDLSNHRFSKQKILESDSKEQLNIDKNIKEKFSKVDVEYILDIVMKP